jgi:hypothetical protein
MNASTGTCRNAIEDVFLNVHLFRERETKSAEHHGKDSSKTSDRIAQGKIQARWAG